MLPGATAVAGASTALGAGVSSLIKILGDDGQDGCEPGQDGSEHEEDDATAARPLSPNLIPSQSL